MVDIDRVDLSELGDLLGQRDYAAGYLDPETGEVYRSFDGEVIGPDGEYVDLDEVDWIAIGGEGSHEAYGDMEEFADAVRDPRLRERFHDALSGKGAFRRFRDVVYNTPEELGQVWNGFSDLRSQERALRWLVREGLVEAAEAEVRTVAIAERADQILAEVRGGPVARLILLNGLPGVGKSTIAKAYVADRPSVLNLDVDVLRTLIGGAWAETAELGRELALDVATAHLRRGHDVVVPQLVARADQVARFADAADEAGARFVHVVLAGSTDPAGPEKDAPVWRAHLTDSEMRRYAGRLDDLVRSPWVAVCERLPGDPEGTVERLVATLRQVE